MIDLVKLVGDEESKEYQSGGELVFQQVFLQTNSSGWSSDDNDKMIIECNFR